MRTTTIFLKILLLLVFISACSNTTENAEHGQAPAVSSDETNIPAVINRETESASKLIDPTPMAKAESASLARIVFITTSQACACTLRRCKNGEASLAAALATHPDAPEVEKLDHARENDRANQIIRKYQARILPIIYFIDKEGNLLSMLEGDFYEEDIAELLDLYAGVKR